ncbi:MAG: alpha/beta hydrolase [Myxococcota bacterium]
MSLTPTRHAWRNLGLDLVYHAWGDEDAPVVIFLHGFLDHGLSFDPVARVLARHYRVIAPDHRGHGQSGRVGAGGYYHFPDYLLDLSRLVDDLETPRAAIIGHSMGASIAAYFAGAWPERTGALVLLDGIGPTAVPPERGPALLRRWVNDVKLSEARDDQAMPDLATVARRVARTSPNASEARLLELAKDSAVQGEDGQWRWRFDPLHRTTGPMPFDAARFGAFLRAVTCPTLVVWGEQSPMRPPDAEARMQMLADVTRYELAGAAHNLHHERPAELAVTLSAFLTSRYAS